MATPPFAKLLEGVVLALSGFVNPERGELRSHAMEMGAQFRPDWGSDCTLLVCAFPNTPKFRQVHADSGTIVSKEWIIECYSKKRLVEIEPYLMNPGKPWRRKPVDSLVGAKQECGHRKDPEQVTKARSKSTLSSSSKDAPPLEDIFPSSEVKKWVTSDLSNTVSWLESQEEKPEPDEVKKIAAEGIITCLQDAVEALESNKDIRDMMDQWMFVPRVVEELAKHGENRARPMSKKELVRLATHCKRIYTDGLSNLEITSPANNEVKRTSGGMEEFQDQHVAGDPGSDSDATIVMTEEEIEQAWRGL